jgi:uncharacterized FlgJ-related protein
MGSLPKALSYAEDSLGVHRTWIELQGVNAHLQDLYRQRSGFESETRTLDAQIETRKNQILREVSLTPTKEMSQAAQDRAYRLACAEDETLASIQEIRLDAMARRDQVAAEIHGAEQNHKAYVARLRELGGYFEYLSAVKTAETMANFNKAEWPY